MGKLSILMLVALVGVAAAMDHAGGHGKGQMMRGGRAHSEGMGGGSKMAVMKIFHSQLKDQLVPDNVFNEEAATALLNNMKEMALDETPKKHPMEQLLESAGLQMPSALKMLPEGSGLATCIGDYQKNMKETCRWMAAASTNSMLCKIECKDQVTTLEEPEVKACMADLKTAMFGKLLMGAKMAMEGEEKLHCAAEMVAATCSAEAQSEADGPTLMKELFRNKVPMGQMLTGPMCGMATFSTMMSEGAETCVCDCFRRRMEEDGMPLEFDMLNTKLEFFQGVSAALESGSPLPDIPAALQKHDKLHGASCLLKYCDKTALMMALKESGLQEMMKEEMKMGRVMKQHAVGHCECLQKAMPDAPFFSENSCSDLPSQLGDQAACASRITTFVQRILDRMSESAGALPA